MPLPSPPATWQGSLPEFHIYWALTQKGFKDGIDFIYQSPQLGGRLQLGGAVVDFYLPGYNLAINIQSIYWHYARPDIAIADKMQRASLEGQGIHIIYIDEEDANRNPIYYLEEALKGNDHSQMTGQ